MKPIIFFDGICNLCNGFTGFVVKRTNKYSFESLQGDIAKEHKLDTDSIVLYDGKHYYYRSAAVIRIISGIGGLYKLINIFRILPICLRDIIYDFIAKHRYKWFGTKPSKR